MKYQIIILLLFLFSCGDRNSNLYYVQPQNQPVAEKPSINDPQDETPGEFLDEVIFMVANGDDTFYSPYLLDNRNQVLPIGIGDQLTECYNGFELKGHYYCGAYDNSNGNLDWTNSMMIKINPEDPSQTERAFDINGGNGDDGIAYKSRFIKDGKVWFLANWGSDFYSWDGENQPAFIGNLTQTSDIWELGDYIYFYDNLKASRVNTITGTVEEIDFSAITPTVDRVVITGVDSKSNKLIVNINQGTDMNAYLLNPTQNVSASDLILIDNSGPFNNPTNIWFAGSTNTNMFFIKEGGLYVFNITNRTLSLIQDESGTGNVQNANNGVSNRNPKGAILKIQEDKVYLRMITQEFGVVFLEYNESNNEVREIFELDFIPSEYHAVEDLIYMVKRNENLYVTDFQTVSLYPDMIVDTGFVLNNNFYAILEPLSGDRELYKIDKGGTPNLFHEFTSDNTDPEFWTDPVGLPILKE